MSLLFSLSLNTPHLPSERKGVANTYPFGIRQYDFVDIPPSRETIRYKLTSGRFVLQLFVYLFTIVGKQSAVIKSMDYQGIYCQVPNRLETYRVGILGWAYNMYCNEHYVLYLLYKCYK